VPDVPYNEQVRYGETVAAADETLGFVQKRAIELDALFASLQHRAFRGEL